MIEGNRISLFDSLAGFHVVGVTTAQHIGFE